VTHKSARWAITRGTETALAGGLVLLCFLIFLGLLTWAFPEGTRLGDLIGDGRTEARFDAKERRLALDIGDFGEGETVAVLSTIENKVKQRARGEIAWEDARAGQPLNHRHRVQTFDASGATITFDEGQVLQLGQNSLVVVKNTGSLTKDLKRQRSLVVLEGRLDGRIAAEAEETLSVELVARNGETKIRPKSAGSRPALFTAIVGPDEQTTLSLQAGEAEIHSGEQSLVVKANQSVVMTKDLKVSEPAPLPPAPEPVSPPDGYTDTFRSRPPVVPFAWRQVAGADRYRLAIARDARFQDVVHEQDVAGTEVAHSHLGAGNYFWRVRSVRADAVGIASETRQFSLATDRDPPRLDIAFPQGIVSASSVVVKGMTDPGTRIYVAERPVEVDGQGRFEQELALERGANMIVVEAVDGSGNTTYRSQVIHARY
jgi:hypothetical protein